MADGRKIPYIIEMGINDEKLKRQMSQWDWEEIIGIKGFGKHFEKPAKEASDAIENAFANTSIDWEKALQTDAFKSAVTKIVQDANKELREGLLGKDEAKQITEFVSEIGKAWKEVGVAMDAKGFARSMAAFSGSVESLIGDVEKLKAVFGGLGDKINNDTAKVAGGFTIIGDAAGRTAVKVNKSIEIMEAKLASIDNMLSEDYGKKFKFDTDLESQFYGIDEEIEKVEKNIKQLSETFNSMSSSDKDFDKTRIQLVQLYTEQIELYRKLELVDKEYTRKYSKDASLLRFNAIDPKAVVGEVRETIETIVGDAKRQMQSITTSTKTTKDGINIPIKLPSQVELVKTINKYVKSINDSDAIHGVRLKLDSGWLNDTANVIEDKTKRAYGDTPADFDKNTSDLVKKTEERFDRVAGVINDKLNGENGILENTKKWRQQMLAQLKFDKEAFSFKFDDKLIEQLNDMFEDYQLKLSVDAEFLSNQIKTVLENSSVSLGGGTANINPEVIMKAVMEGVKLGLFGGDVPTTISSTSNEETVVDQTDKIAGDIVDTAKHLDIAEEYVQDVVEKLKQVARYATKHIGTEKDSKGTKATRELFSSLGGSRVEMFKDENGEEKKKIVPILDLVTINQTEDREAIAKMLEDALLPTDEFGDIKGIAASDKLSKFKDSSSKTIPAFLSSLNEVFYNLQVSTFTADEWVKKREGKQVFDFANEKAKAARHLQTVRSSIKQGNAPSLEEIDQITADMSAYWEQLAKRQLTYKEKDIEALALDKRTSDPSLDFTKSLEMARQEIYEKLLADIKAPLTQLREARVAMGDATEGESVEAFRATAQDFYSSTKQLFVNLKKQAEDAFKGTVFVRGKSGLVPKQIEKYKDFAQIKDNAVIVDVEVNSSLNDVALGVVNGKYNGRPSAGAEKQIMRGQHADFTTPKRYEKAILERPVNYSGFKSQGTPITNIDINQTLEANQKRKEALITEIQLKEREKNSLENEIFALDEKIEQLTERNNKIPEGRRIAAVEKVSRYEAQQEQLTSEILFGDQKIQQITTNIEEQKQKRVRTEQQLTQLTELDVERAKKGIQNKIKDAEKERSALQAQLQEQQKIYGALDTNRVFEQAEVFKARSALKAIPDTKANQSARAEAEQKVVEAEQRLNNATKALNNVGKEINETNEAIEKKTTLVETLNRQVSETTLDTIRTEQQDRIRAIDSVINNLELELADAFSQQSSRKNDLRFTKSKLRNAKNTVAFKTQGELDDTVETRALLGSRLEQATQLLQKNQSEISQLDNINIGLVGWQKRNELQERALVLQGTINKLEQDGASEDVITSKRVELEEINKTLETSIREIVELKKQLETLKAREIELQNMRYGGLPSAQFKQTEEESKRISIQINEIDEKLRSVGGFITQQEAREYSDAERKTYALQEIEKIDKDLITAKAQVQVAKNRLSQVDKKLQELETWKLGAGYGATELAKIKDAKEQEFKSSIEYKSFEEALVEKIRNAKQQAEALTGQATNTHRDTFNEKVTEAMIRDGLNPYDKKATEDFLKTKRGQQLAAQYEQWVAEDTKRILDQYNVDVEEFRRETKELQKQALEEYRKRLVDGDLLDYEEIRENLKKDLEEEKKHRKKEYDPDKYQAKVNQLETDRKTAIAYGGVGDKEILSPEIIQDQIRKQTKLDELLDERIDKEKTLKDLEMAGVQDSDDSVKQAKKEKERLDKEIARYEMLIRNRKKLVEMRYEESKELTYTDEEKELHFTNQIVGYNQKIEDSLAKQEELKQKITKASEEEKEKLQYALKQEEDKVVGWRGKVSKFEGKLQNVATAKSEVAATKTSEVSGGLLGLIKETIGEVGVGDLTKVEEILSEILAILSGSDTVSSTRNTEMDAKLARIKELEVKQQLANEQKKTAETAQQVENAKKETAVSTNVADSKAHKNVSKTQVYKDIQKSVDTFRTSELSADKEPLNAIKIALDELSKINDQNSQEYIEWQRKLGSALAAYGKANGIENGKGYYDRVYAELEKNGITVDPKLAITNKSGVSNALVEKGLVTIKEKEAKAKQSEAKAEEKITEEKKEQEKIRFTRKEKEELNRLKSETKDYNPDATTGAGSEFGGFATENTLRAIFEVLNKISTNGVLRSYTEGDTDSKKSSTPKEDELEKLAKKSGVSDVRAAVKQHGTLDAHGILDMNNLKAVQNYKAEYDVLIAKHKEFDAAGTLYDPANQQILQNMAIKTRDLGKALEKSVSEAEQLQQLVDNSGTFNGQKMGGTKKLAPEETQNLESSMKSYLQSLNLGNIEHVKFDKIHQKLTGTIRTSNKTVADLEVKYNEATGALYAYQKAERESLTGLPAFLNGFKKKLNSIMQYLTMTMSIHQAIAQLRKGIQYVREIDLALTELKKVTDESEETYDKFLETAAKTGARLGTTISAVTEATATFAKLGYSMEQATEMAESAIVYKNVGDNIASTGDAADSIISTLKGFGMEASESMAIVDRFNEVGNKFAITSQGIGEALRLSASAMNEGGNSLDESIALITAANEVVNDPSSVGTALKTLTLRLRGSKTELEEMGEDVSDMAITTSQLQAKLLALTGGQVDIMADANTFKNSTQILREMAAAWKDMTDIQRASALELMGGKRQAKRTNCLNVQKCA